MEIASLCGWDEKRTLNSEHSGAPQLGRPSWASALARTLQAEGTKYLRSTGAGSRALASTVDPSPSDAIRDKCAFLPQTFGDP